MALTDDVREANEISRVTMRSCESLGAPVVFDDSVERWVATLRNESAETSESVRPLIRRDALGLALDMCGADPRGGKFGPPVLACRRHGRKSASTALTAGASARKRAEGERGATFSGSSQFDVPSVPVEIRVLFI
ncbi:hypothetical protein C0Z19_03095 [Trinickia soli]|uniref:Uncharacterized protein n=1 Tax=Trinickia soli TaxID=380675 RepID=A0A2N7WE85_9BURK|nr:hypothetical protein CIW54_17650 [Paraburkholderia sp. T12-10]PMS27674.1 hypothetical protein C0Z19_03095 [Trinickia soli]